MKKEKIFSPIVVSKPLIVKEIEVIEDYDKIKDKVNSLEKGDIINTSFGRIINPTNILLNWTIYDMVNKKELESEYDYREKEDRTLAFSSLYCIYDMVNNISLVYLNNGYGSLEKVIVCKNIYDALYWYDKINNMISLGLKENTTDINIVKNNKINAVDNEEWYRIICRDFNANDNKNDKDKLDFCRLFRFARDKYDYFISISDLLKPVCCYNGMDKIYNEKFNIYFATRTKIVDIKTVLNDPFDYENYSIVFNTFIPNIVRMTNVICKYYNSNSTLDYWLNNGKIINAKNLDSYFDRDHFLAQFSKSFIMV